MEDFSSVVGFGYLKGVHLNDSKTPLGSNKDRHENLGKGFIGLGAFKCIMHDARFDGIPLVLETPLGDDGVEVWKKEIQLLYTL
jgi:endonuclease IV